MSATERRKGAEGEREVVRTLREFGWKLASRTSNGREQARRGDIAEGPSGVHIEVKRQERLNVPKALRQIESDANPFDIPVLVHRPNGQDWMATLPLDELLPLLRLKEAS